MFVTYTINLLLLQVDNLGQIGGSSRESVIRGILYRLIGPGLNNHMTFTGSSTPPSKKTALRNTNLHKVIVGK